MPLLPPRLPLLVGLVGALWASPAPLPAARADAGEAPFIVELVARSFFRGLLEGEVQIALSLCAGAVSFDGRRVQGRQALERKLAALSRRARERGLRLVRIVVLSREEVITRYGPPPARLRGALGRGTRVALARFNQLGAVAVLGRWRGYWRVLALSD